MTGPVAAGLPHDGRIGHARLVAGQRVIAVLYMRAKLVVMKGMVRRTEPPQHRRVQSQRFHRIPDADHLDRHIRVTMHAGKGVGRIAAAPRLVMPVHFTNVPLGCALGLEQAQKADDPRQRPHRISAARIAHQENPVTGAVARCQIAIGAADLAVDPAPQQHIARPPPVRPLQAGFVIDRHVRAGLMEQLVGQTCVRFEIGHERGHRAIKDNDMGGRPAPARRPGRSTRAESSTQPTGNCSIQPRQAHSSAFPILASV